MVSTLMKQFAACLVVVGLVGLVLGAQEVHHRLLRLETQVAVAEQRATVAEKRLAVAERAALYLFIPTDVNDEVGKPLRRADLVDRALRVSLK